MTKKALEKLNEKQLAYLDTARKILQMAREHGLKPDEEKQKGKIRGYLDCLCNMEAISGGEAKALYTYYTL